MSAASLARITYDAAIARKANLCERAVANALKRLRELGVLNWVRRCAESWRDGRFVLEQQTNAYAVLPESQWPRSIATCRLTRTLHASNCWNSLKLFEWPANGVTS
jgi:hypothetical protein